MKSQKEGTYFWFCTVLPLLQKIKPVLMLVERTTTAPDTSLKPLWAIDTEKNRMTHVYRAPFMHLEADLSQTMVFQANCIDYPVSSNFEGSKYITFVAMSILEEAKFYNWYQNPYFLKHFAGVQGTPSCNKQSTIAKRSFTSPKGRLPRLHGRDILGEGCEDGPQNRWKNIATSTDKPGKPIYWQNLNEEERQQGQILQGGHYMTPTQNKCLVFLVGKSLKIAIQIAACLIPPRFMGPL